MPLKLIINEKEEFDEKNNKFIVTPELELQFEHSLASLSSWESKWEKPFISADTKTEEETFSYIQEMCLTPNVSVETLRQLDDASLEKIYKYIEAKMTATWFRELPNKPGVREVITAEIIYYWMIALNIPVEFETWHLGKLFTLIKVTNEKNNPTKDKPRSAAEISAERRELNRRRRLELGSTG